MIILLRHISINILKPRNKSSSGNKYHIRQFFSASISAPAG
jgi:hypothetical protein